MLSLPEPSNKKSANDLPVVQLTESADVLDDLFAMIYQIPKAVPTSYDQALALLAACQKYDMVTTQSHIRAAIEGGKLAPTGVAAFRAFAFASSAMLRPEMETTARLTLDFPMTIEYLGKELMSCEGWALRDLAKYRKRCRESLISCLDTFIQSLDDNMPSQIFSSCHEASSLLQPSELHPSFRRISLIHSEISATSNSHSSSLGSRPSPEKCVPWLRDLFEQQSAKMGQAFTEPLLNPSSLCAEYLKALQGHVNLRNCSPCMKAHIFQGDALCKDLEGRLALARNQASITI